MIANNSILFQQYNILELFVIYAIYFQYIYRYILFLVNKNKCLECIYCQKIIQNPIKKLCKFDHLLTVKKLIK